MCSRCRCSLHAHQVAVFNQLVACLHNLPFMDNFCLANNKQNKKKRMQNKITRARTTHTHMQFLSKTSVNMMKMHLTWWFHANSKFRTMPSNCSLQIVHQLNWHISIFAQLFIGLMRFFRILNFDYFGRIRPDIYHMAWIQPHNAMRWFNFNCARLSHHLLTLIRCFLLQPKHNCVCTTIGS